MDMETVMFDASDSETSLDKTATIKIEPETVVRLFHELYYGSAEQTWFNTTWLGIPLLKCPLDLWDYQEIIVETQPDIIIETGTYKGGSALYFAFLLDLLGNAGQVVSIDVAAFPDLPNHPLITYLDGSSTEDHIVTQVEALVQSKKRVMVILDSDHACEHVFKEMNIYGPMVTPGAYMIVEDSNVNGHPVKPEHGPGPMEAIERYLKKNDDFDVDRGCEKFLMTQNPKGYLCKK